MKNNLIEQDSKQAWLRLIIIFTMSVIGTAGMWSVVIIMPNIQNEFELDRAASTYPYVATMFGYGIGNVIILPMRYINFSPNTSLSPPSG